MVQIHSPRPLFSITYSRFWRRKKAAVDDFVAARPARFRLSAPTSTTEKAPSRLVRQMFRSQIAAPHPIESFRCIRFVAEGNSRVHFFRRLLWPNRELGVRYHSSHVSGPGNFEGAVRPFVVRDNLDAWVVAG